jgi:hypothetical protein
MLDSFLLLNSINDAILILAQSKRATAQGATAVWAKVHNAEKYLNSQVGELLAPPPAEEVLSNAA